MSPARRAGSGAGTACSIRIAHSRPDVMYASDARIDARIAATASAGPFRLMLPLLLFIGAGCGGGEVGKRRVRLTKEVERRVALLTPAIEGRGAKGSWYACFKDEDVVFKRDMRGPQRVAIEVEGMAATCHRRHELVHHATADADELVLRRVPRERDLLRRQ